MAPNEGRSEPGKHQSFQDSSPLSRFRLFFKPGAAMGVALVIVLLTAVGVVRALTLDGSDTGLPLVQSSSSSSGSDAPANAEGQEGDSDGTGDSEPGEPPEGTGNQEALGYGLSGGTHGGVGSSGEMLVHVTGAVVSPGVVRLAGGTRVIDAVESAGGLTADADISGINLAAFASDGSQIHVPVIGEAPIATTAAPAGGGSTGSGCIDLNTASERELEELDGVGPKIAARIVDHRTSNGPFASSSDLMAIPGIGAVLSQKIGAGACQ